MWIFGGWFSSYAAPPRDVWNTSDGKTWTLVEKDAPWKHSDLPMTLVFDGKMWLMGGWYNGRLPDHSASNEVWYSDDGKNWKKTRCNAPWSPRLAAAAVVFKGKMWILGGIDDYYFGDDKSLKNDVWCSADGKTWEMATANAPWSPRAYHQAVVFDGKIWLFGGGNYVPKHHALNDVWCSEDGTNWTKVTDFAQWGPRLWFSALVYRDRMWVIGGWSKKTDNYGDVWYSRDGKNWTQLESDIIWKSRHEHSGLVFQDKIWIMGGYPRPELSNEVWSLYIPPGK
jgi:N-acetylneuraminic acid mutarotase